LSKKQRFKEAKPLHALIVRKFKKTGRSETEPTAKFAAANWAQTMQWICLPLQAVGCRSPTSDDTAQRMIRRRNCRHFPFAPNAQKLRNIQLPGNSYASKCAGFGKKIYWTLNARIKSPTFNKKSTTNEPRHSNTVPVLFLLFLLKSEEDKKETKETATVLECLGSSTT
jgi:hypothetical protein